MDRQSRPTPPLLQLKSTPRNISTAPDAEGNVRQTWVMRRGSVIQRFFFLLCRLPVSQLIPKTYV
jgi:hypothetical protein